MLTRRALLAAPLAVPGWARAQASPLTQLLLREEALPPLLDAFGGGLLHRVPFRETAGATAPTALPANPIDSNFGYRHQGGTFTIDDYLARQRVTGLLALRGGAVAFERYAHGHGANTRFLSASIAKSVIGLLAGIALAEGAIRSAGDLARDYVTALAETAYGEVPVRDLLTMSSGVRFAERYDGADDLARLLDDSIGGRSAGGAAVLAPYRERRAAPGRLFHYSSADTQALALAVRAAVGMPLTDYLGVRLWRPMGAEAPAAFLLDAAGMEAGYAFLHARLRDFARLGQLLAEGGRGIVPQPWLAQAATAAPHAAPFVASDHFGYGQHFWIFPGGRQFALLGVRGQCVFVDPQRKLVLAQTAAWRTAGDRAARAELLSLWQALVEAV